MIHGPSTIKGPRAEVLFGAFKKKLNSEIKVAQFSGDLGRLNEEHWTTLQLTWASRFDV